LIDFDNLLFDASYKVKYTTNNQKLVQFTFSQRQKQTKSGNGNWK